MRFDPNVRHTSQLACSAEDFATLQLALAAVVAKHDEGVFDRHMQVLVDNPKPNSDPVVRTRWDAFWLARKSFPIDAETGGPSAFRDAKDDHIASALKRLLPN